MKLKRNILSSALAILLCLSLTLPALASYSYTVQKGDSLWKIAKKQMGSGTRWAEIYEANRDTVSDPAKIYPGQLLAIPTDDAGAETPTEAAETPADTETPTENTDATDAAVVPADAAEEFPAAYQLEVANCFSEVMKRHASISAQGVEYIGGEPMEFTLFGSDDMLYFDNGTFQRLVEDGRQLRTENGMLIATLFMTEGDRQQVVNEIQAYFARFFGTEKWVETSVEDNAYAIVTEQNDAEQVAQKLEAYGYDAAEGAAIVMNYRYDRDDLDLLDYTETVRYADGSEQPLSKTVFTYDTGMERADTPFAEFYSGEPFLLTVTGNPGVPALEQTETYTMTKGMFELVCNDETVENYYTDADCTQLYEGRDADDYSDLHLYFKSSYSALGEEEQELFRKAAEINTAEGLLSRHSSVSVDSATYYDGAIVVNDSRYLDAQRFVYAESTGINVYMEPAEGRLFARKPDGSCALLLMNDAAAVDTQYRSTRKGFSIDLLEGEEPVFVKEEDGTLCFITAAPEATARAYDQILVEGCDLPEDAFQDGMTLLHYLYLDAETLEAIGETYYLVEADGTRHLSFMAAVGYDYICRYENMPYAPFFEEASRTVTVIFDPGTAEEVTVSASQPAGVTFSAVYQGERVDTLYTDPACTQAYTGGDDISGGSLTLYYKAIPAGAGE